MAGSTVGRSFSGEIFLSKGHLAFALSFITICMHVPIRSYAQTGFLSNDCGSTQSNYTDNLPLHWVTDDGTYIKSGKSFSMPSVRENKSELLSLKSFRYFPEGRKKYCYDLPTTPNSTYLIRARFYMNDTVLNERKHFYFTVSINATNWFSLGDGNNIVPDLFVRQEGIFYSPGNVMYLCLQPVVGIPFISSLELRELEPSMYQYSGNTLQYLALLFRYNLGAVEPTPSVRYPYDIYDRYWQTLDGTDAYTLPIFATSAAPDQTNRSEVYYVPPEVMRDGWLFTYPLDRVTGNLFFNDPQVYSSPGAYAFFVLYAEHLNASDSQIYPLNLTVNGQRGPAWNFSNQATLVKIPNYILSSNVLSIRVDLEPSANLSDGPTLNAVEAYVQYNFNFSTTYQPDDDAITALKGSFNLTDWQGDPCTPVPHDWLDCSSESPTFQPIRQPCFSEESSVSQCIVQEGFLRSTFYVINISLANLPRSGFDLLIAADVTLGSLNNMSITSSGVDGQTFQFLINKFSNITKLTVLDFSHNAIDSLPNWKDVKNLVHLNLAYNNLIDLLSSPQDLLLPTTLQTLNLANNAIVSIPMAWQNTANSLVSLDLSRNKLQGDISSLDRMLRMNSGSLQELDVSGNNFVGTFSGSLYFSSLSNLAVANFTDNEIQGTLNLILWFDTVIDAGLGKVKAAVATYQVFSFVNNNITSIVQEVPWGVSVLLGSKHHGGLNWAQRYNICMGVARGLSYLHEELQPAVIHRDIKPANILLDKNFQPKIADFGLARYSSDETNQYMQTGIAGTLGYFAPEYAMYGQLSSMADVYSYGIVVLEIVSGRKCIDSSLPEDEKFLKYWACTLIRRGLLIDILEPDFRGFYVPAEVIRAVNIALLCVQHRPERRPSMSQVVTMLSGKVDFEGFLGESKTVQSNLEDLLVTITDDKDYQALQKLADDLTIHAPLNLNSVSSSTTFASSGSRTERLIELSAVRRR